MILDVLTLVVMVMLVVAVVGLFAMMGELNSKVSADDVRTPGETYWPAENARSGPLESWPDALAPVMSGRSFVIALSTSCGTCHQLLEEDPQGLVSVLPTAVVVVGGELRSAQAFVSRYPVLATVPTHIDVGGEWLHDSLGLDSSPAVLSVQDGEVLAVHNFNRSSALADLARASTTESRVR